MRSSHTPVVPILVSVLSLTRAAVFAAAPPGAHAQPFADYAGSNYLPATPSVSGGALGALGNPAAWATTDRGELDLWWNDHVFSDDDLGDWGFSMGRHLGIAMDSRKFGPTGEPIFSILDGVGPTFPTGRVIDWQVGLAGGDRRHFFGAAWRWSGGNEELLGREHGFNIGLIERPAPWLSAGLAGLLSTRSNARLGVFDIGVRPTGANWLTLFADYSLRNDQRLSDGNWGAGLEARPVRGVHLSAKFLKAPAPDRFSLLFSAGIGFGGASYSMVTSSDRHGKDIASTYVVRFAPPYREVTLPPDLRGDSGKRYIPINLENRQLTYQKYRLFDDKRVAWIDLAQRLDAIRDDKSVRGVAVNIAGLQTRPSIAWELREKLLGLRAAGKEVIVHADHLDMRGMWLASAADRLTLDPQGEITVPGFALHRTYMKDLLGKLGVGFQELRYFRYKSAVEVLAREEMSPGDREQRGRMVDVLYETMRDDVCAGRRLTAARFDSLVNDQVILQPSSAKQAGLVDEIARWSDVPKWLEKERDGAGLVRMSREYRRQYYDEVWGRPPTVAIVYAVGDCAMDTGIKGRSTSAHMRKLVDDPDVAAVVLRADSPGGDPLPSDLVAEATMKLIKAGKPVVISQGDVAASGGYWISMEGSRILTTPVTVTGSIGVIAGWYYDDGLGKKTGLRADGVQRGEHADLFAGVRFPLLGIAVPERALDENELALVKKYILSTYDEFVGKVAAARKLPDDRVREIAQGRVWMGDDAVERGLCDKTGGMTDAIALARELAGIKPGAEIILSEYPERPLFQWPQLKLPVPGATAAAAWLARTFGAGSGADELSGAAADEGWPAAAFAAGLAATDGAGEDYGFRYLRRIAQSPASPLLMLPPESLPPGWGSQP